MLRTDKQKQSEIKKGMSMKRIIGICLGLAALLASCTQHDELVDSGLIRLGVKAGAYSRASATSQGLAAIGDKIGIYGVVTKQNSAIDLLSNEWTLNPLMNNVRTTSVDETTGAITWTNAYSYPQEAGRYVKFCAYHPYALAANSASGNYVEMKSGQAPLLHFTLTGSEDVMCAAPVIGSRDETPKPLVFDHKLTQLRFKLLDTEGILQNAKVTKVVLNDVNTSSTMNIETGELGEWGTPATLNVQTQAIGVKNGVDLEKAVMLQPGQPTFAMTITADNGTVYPEVKIKPDNDPAFLAGKSYLVTLTFRNKKGISVKAIVQPWILGGYAENIVQ